MKDKTEIQKLVAAIDRYKVEVEKLKKDLKDKAGDYEDRIKHQKQRIFLLEEEAEDLKSKIEEFRELIIRLNLKLMDQENSTDNYLQQLKEKQRR
jgi:predicted  nucleic acid-binding Zn-ribbon protein